MAKTKNVQDFSPAATRIYNAAKKGIVNRTNSSHVKRVIDAELKKHSLSKEEVKKEIYDGITKGNAEENEALWKNIKETEKFFKNQISELNVEIKGLQGDAKIFVKTATKELKDENSVLKQQAKTLTEENKNLVERVNGLTEQNTDSKPQDDTPPNSDQEKINDAPDPANKEPSEEKKK